MSDIPECKSIRREGLCPLEDHLDLMIDEFKRIKALTKDTEIQGLCDRAISNTQQLVPVIVQRDKAEKELTASQARCKELEVTGAGMFLRGIRHAQTLIENDDPRCTLEVLQNDPESYRKGKSHAVGVISKYLKG
jgi:hypothetical protein